MIPTLKIHFGTILHYFQEIKNNFKIIFHMINAFNIIQKPTANILNLFLKINYF